VLGSFIAGQIVTRTGRYRIFPIAGAAAMAAVCLAIAFVGLGHTLAFDLIATGLLGLSFGFQLSPVMVALQNALDRRDTGIGMSGMIFFRLMGGAFGVALLSSILVAAFNQGVVAVPGHAVLGDNPGLALFHLEDGLPPALLRDLAGVIAGGFRVVFLVAAVIAACAALGACFLKETALRSAESQPQEPGRQPAE
jgi:MFS family permease